MPIRIQRRRTKGWRMPANTVYVGRPTQWGNPWRVGQWETGELQADGTNIHRITAEEAVENFRFTMCPIEGRPGFVTDFEMAEIDLRPLRGKDLACWCPLSQACHADVLLELANAPSSDGT